MASSSMTFDGQPKKANLIFEARKFTGQESRPAPYMGSALAHHHIHHGLDRLIGTVP